MIPSRMLQSPPSTIGKGVAIDDGADGIGKLDRVVAQTAGVEHARLRIDPLIEGRYGQPVTALGAEPVCEPRPDQSRG
jgi:hypothetical protein